MNEKRETSDELELTTESSRHDWTYLDVGCVELGHVLIREFAGDDDLVGHGEKEGGGRDGREWESEARGQDGAEDELIRDCRSEEAVPAGDSINKSMIVR